MLTLSRVRGILSPIFSAPKRFIHGDGNIHGESSQASSLTNEQIPKQDKLFRSVQLDIYGHQKEVMFSYMSYLKLVCSHLEVKKSKVLRLPTVKWYQYALRCKFAKKKYKLHYETRTHIHRLSLYDVTGSTASTFLEYTQRNLPEGIGMKVTYDELCFLPDMVLEKLQEAATVEEADVSFKRLENSEESKNSEETKEF
ncbi:ribosomal protein s10p/S20e domain-containing protein [Ditylenchus destructor]|nr:ribosomal protein s10p/S20e domain-containing protein [Ditylenchus destructor]